MSKPIHGGGVDRAMAELGFSREQILDFSASINPFGTPSEVSTALEEGLARISDYPEIDAASLRSALADFHQLAEANLLPGSGSTELIYLLPRVFKPGRALLVEPCFSEYAPALQQVGCQLDRVCLSPETGFRFSAEQIFNSLQADTELVMLANPGNPTGVGIEPEELLRLAAGLGACRLLVDEAFVDFCPQRSVLSQITVVENLLVLRSMTKFYAIPGLRVGYLAGSATDIEQIAALKEPWTLSNLAISAGKACLAATGYQQTTLQTIPGLRKNLAQGLLELGFEVFDGEANYLLCRLPDTAADVDAQHLKDQLFQQGILVRACDDFGSLDADYLRFAVLSHEANQALLKALREFFSGRFRQGGLSRYDDK
jgi:threonine-phosphate decarboxylase